MNSGTFLSRLLLVLSQLMSAVVFLLLPLILERASADDIELVSIRELWEQSGIALPTLTAHTLFFSDHNRLRIIGFLLLLAAGILVEWYMRDKKKSGVYHSICLAGSVVAGFLFLTACLLPFVPL